jgi:hypothetical protein
VIDEVEGRLPSAEPITEINDQNAADYLSAFAAQQSYGMLDANADWNQLFESPAQELFGLNLIYEYAPFYAGDDMTITYRNGTPDSGEWLSLYQPDVFTGSLTTGGDFYNFFVLGLPPANFDEEYATYRASHPLTLPVLRVGLDESEAGFFSWHNNSPAYPNDPIMIQEDLGIFASGSLTGYHLSGIDAAVLSVPSFDFNGNGIETFSEAANDFVANATQRDASTIIIDLQQNDGGLALLAMVLFSKVCHIVDRFLGCLLGRKAFQAKLYLQFFPHDVPFAGSRMRSHPEANILGEILTKEYQSLSIRSPVSNADDNDVNDPFGSEWVATDRINGETARGFRSWEEYQGPIRNNGDNFTLTQRYNSSDPLFAYLLSTYARLADNSTSSRKSTWAASDITILTDGICGSTCSLFVEMMREQGVRSVVVGGLPEPGPMQAACGSRGAAAYTDHELFDDYDQARGADPVAGATLPQWPSDSAIQGITVGFTIRDQIRPNTSIPNQVLYLPADCRLYWTFSNIYNLTQLWTDAYNAVYYDQSSCVPGSINATLPLTNHTIASSSHFESISHSIVKGLVNSENDVDLIDLLDDSVLGDVEDNTPNGGGRVAYRTCSVGRPCDWGDECYTVDFACKDPWIEEGICSRECYHGQNNCGRGSCVTNRYAVSKVNNISSGRKIEQGFCHPALNKLVEMRCSALKAIPSILAGVLADA